MPRAFFNIPGKDPGRHIPFRVNGLNPSAESVPVHDIVMDKGECMGELKCECHGIISAELPCLIESAESTTTAGRSRFPPTHSGGQMPC